MPPFTSVADDFSKALASGFVTNFGAYMRELERATAELLKVHSVAVSSGTAGLILALQALGLRPGQSVVIPSMTFVATAQAVLYAQGIPVFADIGRDCTLDPDDLAEVLDVHEDVDVVMPVHTYGQPCRIDHIASVVKDAERKSGKRIAILYDAAHAFGAASHDRPVGGFGDAEVFSLSFSKILSSVEGGLVTTADGGVAGRVREMRNYGFGCGYDANGPGLNGKMSELHAIVGLANMRRLDELSHTREEKARYYLGRLSALEHFETPALSPGVVHAYKDMAILVAGALVHQRDAVMDYLRRNGIETRAYFSPPVHRQQGFRKFYDRRLPVTEEIAGRVICIPFYTTITRDEMDYVADALAQADANLR